MGILLGNLSIAQTEERLGIELTEDERNELTATRQQEATNIAPDKWHCFDLPFVMACGSRECAERVHKILSPYSSQMKEQITIGIQPARKEQE